MINTTTDGKYKLTEEIDAWYELQSTGSIVHITAIRNGVDVWGHTDSHCDPSGCSAHDLFFSQVSAEDVAVGNVYEIDEAGKVLYQIDEL